MPLNWHQKTIVLWIQNDPELRDLAQRYVDTARARKERKEKAAQRMCEWLHMQGRFATPEGAHFTVTAIRHAMTGM
jgi:hypothetical protein